MPLTHRSSGALRAASLEIEQLMRSFGSVVRSVGARHGLRGSDMDEMIQETRIRLWRTIERAKVDAAIPSTYVYRAALSATVDLLRRRRARREEPPELLADEAAREDAESALAGSELAEQVEGALAELQATRAPVVRLYLAGYDRDEIADLMGWSEPKVRNLLYRGLADLREALLRRGITPPGRAGPPALTVVRPGDPA